MGGSIVGGVGGRRWPHSENLGESDIAEEEIFLKHGGVVDFLGTFADSGRGDVDPCPAAYGIRGRQAKGVHDWAVATGQTRSGDGLEFADEAVGALLTLGDEVAAGQVVRVQAVMATKCWVG